MKFFYNTEVNMNKMKTKTCQNEPESRRPIHSARVPGSRVTGSDYINNKHARNNSF